MTTIGDVPRIPPKGGLARDRIAAELRNAIVHGRLQPGERLVEDRIMEWLEATRGATREAFRELEHEGLVISYPHRGAVVVGVTEDEVHSVLIPIRLVLEEFAFTMALEQATTADLAELAGHLWTMEQAAEAGDLDAIVQADVDFHEAVLHIAPQFHTIHIWRSIAPRIRAYFYRHFRERDLDSVVDRAPRAARGTAARRREAPARGAPPAHRRAPAACRASRRPHETSSAHQPAEGSPA